VRHADQVNAETAGPAVLLELAAFTARAAGLLLTGREPGGAGRREDRPKVVSTKSSPTDVVTEMDRASEELIIERIRAQRPGDAFLGEEGGDAAGHGAGGAPVRWIVDPIDGTVNYLYGLPDWAVSIAAEVWDEPGGFPGPGSGGALAERADRIMAAVVAVPERGEMFTAVRGGGAWLHRSAAPDGYGSERPVRLRCNADVPPDRALVGTGFGYAAGRRAVQGEVVAALLPQVRDIRRGGSCAVDLCSVAAGRLDAFYERGTQYWDRAAAGLIAREAGARVEGLHRKPDSPDLAIAAGPGLFGQLHDLLAALDPERDAA
jgi:myo-inositol-1(or 4)-monophosphatase